MNLFPLRGINGLQSLSRILNGLRKSVYIINECKPIYNDLKPLVTRGKSFLSSINNYPYNKVNYKFSDKNDYNNKMANLPKFFI